MTPIVPGRWFSKSTGNPVEVIEANRGSVRYRIGKAVVVVNEMKFRQQHKPEIQVEGGREG